VREKEEKQSKLVNCFFHCIIKIATKGIPKRVKSHRQNNLRDMGQLYR
jgi:hypothetical protein